MGMDMDFVKKVTNYDSVASLGKCWPIHNWLINNGFIVDNGCDVVPISEPVKNKLIKDIDKVIKDNSVASEIFPLDPPDIHSTWYEKYDEYFFTMLKDLRRKLKNEKEPIYYKYWY